MDAAEFPEEVSGAGGIWRLGCIGKDGLLMGFARLGRDAIERLKKHKTDIWTRSDQPARYCMMYLVEYRSFQRTYGEWETKK